jgi:general stress protein 26
MVQTDPIARLNELISGIDVATLTTVRPDSTLHSCPMITGAADEGGAFWYITSSDTEKVEAVRTIQRVNLAFSDAPAQRYISVSGFCELVRNQATLKQLWKPEYESWFPAGLKDPDLILMRIVVQQAEYWDSAQARMVPLLGFSEAAIG